MVRPERDPIGGEWPVEGGRNVHRRKAPGPDPNLPSGQRLQPRGGHGRGFIAGRLRLQVIPNRKQETLEPFVLANVQSGTEAHEPTDGPATITCTIWAIGM